MFIGPAARIKILLTNSSKSNYTKPNH